MNGDVQIFYARTKPGNSASVIIYECQQIASVTFSLNDMNVTTFSLNCS